MSSVKCSQCGLVNFASAQSCQRCGGALAAAGSVLAGGSNTFTMNGNGISGGLYYRHSGKFTLTGLALGLGVGVLAGLILAVVYSYVISYIPLIYLNALCAVGYGIALGFVIAGVMKWTKVRNQALCGAVGLLVGLISLYVSWAVWLSVLLSSEVEISAVALALEPALLWDVVQRVNEVGAWSIKSLTFSGTALWVVWASEAIIVVGGASLIAFGMLGAAPFCEGCQTWCQETEGLMFLGAGDSAELKRRVEAKDFGFLKAMGAKQADSYDWYRVDLYDCPCGRTNTLAVKQERVSVDAKGKSTTKTADVVPQLLISRGDVNTLRHLSQEIIQPSPAGLAPAV